MMDAFPKSVPMLFLQFLIIATLNLGSSCYANIDVACLESEKRALLSFKQGLEDPSNRLSSWGVEDDCCEWAGVVCDNSTDHVRELHLQSPYDEEDYEIWSQYATSEKVKLGGEVNPSLLNLKHLSYLDLSQNDFGGIPIPSFLGSLPSLQYLNLSEAGFAGTVPHQLGNLSGLRSLNLKGLPYGDAQLDVENLDWLSGFLTLEHLDLRQVNLAKAPNWLQAVNKLPSLVELHLSYCELDRIPPLKHVNFKSLVVLDLSGNRFFSLIPRWIFSLSSLASLNLGSSNFEGQIPDGFWNLTSLKVLDVSSNDLNSLLPNSLFGLHSLVSLNLSAMNDIRFEGPIPSGLQNLTSLEELSLSGFGFNSSIPEWLYSLWHLEMLDLGYNQLNGVISSSIGNLTSLVILDLSRNDLEGGIPREAGNLCKLRRLILSGYSGIRSGGDISDLFRTLSGCISYSLEILKLTKSRISGHLTDQLGQFINLKVLFLDLNSISGPIPLSLGRCSSLLTLSLARNQLNGTLPESLGCLSKLKHLWISRNLFEGVVSEVHFANLTSLTIFDASGNQLILEVSPNWIPPFQLAEIELRSWYLGPQFPMWLHSQKGFSVLDLSCTGISDSIPSWFWNLSFSIQNLNLSHNQIKGKIPDILDGDYSMIYLGSNQFTGPLPRLSSNVTELDLSNNAFSGDIRHFICDGKDESNRLTILHLGENLLSGEIPDCWMNWTALRVIKLGNNHLSGTIPSSLGNLLQLQSLHLRNNSLSGEVPLSLQNCTELVTIDLGWNQLVGSIHTWLGRSLSNLKILGLRSNNFYGEIPSELCHFASLQILDLASNSFSGSIPRCFKNLTAMAIKSHSQDHGRYSNDWIFYSSNWRSFLENAFVVTKGRELQYNTLLPLVTSMDLSDNDIVVPKTRMIPKEIGNMELLESLDFSRNQLSGEIPPSMSALTFLSFLNVSNNNLSGQIPSSTQLQSQNASSFTGNSLCGPPLVENCSTGGATPDIGEGDEGGDSEVNWFFLTAAYGFVVGFWVIVSPILFKRSWRFAYFRFLDEMWHRICTCFGKP
ncbi:LRR receptor-like serine/threonine-protein kinase [Actinidia chinensis var. chinensis]|uniref:LRR receptor-like serine/threonine-protein kinase n=1 Tax=Actinidia chinensis var. chinensis TaxID=1590841 RepID=A0A2R6PMA8_ACTCC|nr:LRR receptor-like serine/threonine-protein kinase [Actinidia chinensis var. chinensis]